MRRKGKDKLLYVLGRGGKCSFGEVVDIMFKRKSESKCITGLD